MDNGRVKDLASKKKKLERRLFAKCKRGTATDVEKTQYLQLSGRLDLPDVETVQIKQARLQRDRLNKRCKRGTATEGEKMELVEQNGTVPSVESTEQKEERLRKERDRGCL